MWSEESSWMSWDLSQALMLSRGEGVQDETIMNKGAGMGKYKVIKGSEAFMDLWIHIKQYWGLWDPFCTLAYSTSGKVPRLSSLQKCSTCI